MNRSAFIFGVLICLAAGAPARAQIGPGDGRAALDSLLASDDTAESSLLFETLSVDFGTVSEDDSLLTVRFPFRNAGAEPVTVTQVTTTCGCTSALVEAASGAPAASATVPAGVSGAVVLTFNPKNRPGSAEVRAFVYTSESLSASSSAASSASGSASSSAASSASGSASALRPAARLFLRGEVVETSPWSHYPFSMGKLRMMGREVTLTLTGAAGKAVERILCANSGEKPLTLSAEGLPPYARFRTEPETIPPGGEADLVISIDMDAASEWDRELKGFSFLVRGAVVRPGPESFIRVWIKRE